MAFTSSSHQQNVFSGIESPNKRRKVEESSRLFDVFINHRGPDVKQTLATQLYNSLQQRGIRTFLDSKETELGTSFPRAIQTAICSASAHIAIFSKGYAQSSWCLDELVLMLQSKAKIIPVFYQVQPWELRHIEKGVYAGAFLEYESKGRYMEKINEWRKALQSVSFTTGCQFNVSDSGDCKEIVSAVEKEVQKTKHLHVAKHPVGLHKLVRDFEWQCLRDRVQDFESHCRMNKAGKENANVVGIFGMGGVGKTTLSKELFNQKKSIYTKSSFLFDVREASSRTELPDLQSTLLKDLFCEDRRFRSPEEGTSCLRDRFERSGSLSFLIVLDDIDHVEQLDDLIAMDILNKHGNNLVIITTRDVGVLVRAGIEIGYHLKGLDREDGTELFCWHAFRQSHPSSGYEDLVEKFVNKCGGLPLSLQVLGRHVSGQDQRYWREELEKVSKTLPGDVKRSLKISFDSLDYEEKQVFMDVACFFINKSKTMAMTIWGRSGWSFHNALKTLQDKCLLEEDDIGHWPLVDCRRKSCRAFGGLQTDCYRPFLDRKCNNIWDGFVFRMHDHLRDLGREMANELDHPRRVWHPQHLKSLELKGFQNILAQASRDRCFHYIWDESMGCQITYFLGEPEYSSDASLLWLHLEYRNRRQLDLNSDINPSIPSWIPLQNLQCLRIGGGYFQRLWQSDMQGVSGIPDLIKLKRLYIKECYKLEELPNLSRLGCLEQIEIDNCNKLQNIMLSVQSCTNLHRVAGDVRKLTDLCIQNCPQLKESPTLSRVSCLRNVEIYSCQKLESITLPTTLSSLSVKSCGSLRRIAGELTEFKALYINDCPQLEELPNLARLSCLEQIELDNCNKLQNITLPRALIRLSVGCCRDLQRVAGDLTKFTALYINDCPQLEEFPSFSRVSCSQQIRIYSCQKLENITLPTTLISLSVRSCRDLQRVAGDLTKLTAFYIRDCPELEELPSLCSVSRFRIFVIDCCEKVHTISGLEELDVSKYMRLCYCSKAVIENFIHKLKSVPRRMDMIGRAVDVTVSSLKPNLFCDYKITVIRVRTSKTYCPDWSKLSAVIACYMVDVDSHTPVPEISKSVPKYYYSENDYSYDYDFNSDSDSDSDSYHGLIMRQGNGLLLL